MNRQLWNVVCALSVAGGCLVGCEKEAGKPHSPPAAAPDAATKESPGDSMEVMCRLCRDVDFLHQGRVKLVTLTYLEGGAKDEHGREYKVTRAEWDQMLATIRATPDGKAAARALPAKAKNYGDGRGAVRRFAYMLTPTAEGAIAFENVKDLESESAG